MACVENIPPLHGDSEMEEGEIVDDLSDISSEEEFLLRQRLKVLENYNNVLERKKAKRTSVGPGTQLKKEDSLLQELSEISTTELDDYTELPHKTKVLKRVKSHHKKRRREEVNEFNLCKTREPKKKSYKTKRKLEVKIISETSDESEDDYRNRRRKLADAVLVNNFKTRNDKTSLSERLQKMLCGVNPEPTKLNLPEINTTNLEQKLINEIPFPPSPPTKEIEIFSQIQDSLKKNQSPNELIDLCTDSDSRTNSAIRTLQDDSVDTVDSAIKPVESDIHNEKAINDQIKSDKDSDEDIELLRQHALKTKSTKQKVQVDLFNLENKVSEDEDSDTAELRLICLKSALLKKAIEMKQKQKLRKRLSQSSNLNDDLLKDNDLFANEVNSENNTDIESVDMDIGSDVEEKGREHTSDNTNVASIEEINLKTKSAPEIIPALVRHEDELEEDEDLLRAKLLTSLSKNLPNLVDPKVMKTVTAVKDTGQILKPLPEKTVIPEEKRFIINLGESDSEGEHEATKNLTKMHIKLSEQVDFQQKLDIFLKSARMEVEKTTLPDVVQQPVIPKKPEKFVAKAVKHLPKSEQIEYKNLVKRMAELEKMKQARQMNLNLNKTLDHMKDTLKPRNAAESNNLTTINNLEQRIQASRKNIAEESAKMLQLKEEGVKLSQKYKIVATELRNIRTAIAFNKKQQRSVQTCLTKIRHHHQMLLKSSMATVHSKINAQIPPLNPMKLQKENNPVKEDKVPQSKPKNNIAREVKDKAPTSQLQKEINLEKQSTIPQPKVTKIKMIKDNVNTHEQIPPNPMKLCKENSIPKEEKTNEPKEGIKVKDIKSPSKEIKEPLIIHHPRLSVQLDFTSNKKVVRMKDSEIHDSSTEVNVKENKVGTKTVPSYPVEGKGGGERHSIKRNNDDYRSPLDAFGNNTWEGDPNAILCPFEVSGDCKDAACKYLHTHTHRSK